MVQATHSCKLICTLLSCAQALHLSYLDANTSIAGPLRAVSPSWAGEGEVCTAKGLIAEVLKLLYMHQYRCGSLRCAVSIMTNV